MLDVRDMTRPNRVNCVSATNCSSTWTNSAGPTR